MAWQLWLVWVLISLPILSVDIFCLIDEYKMVSTFYYLATSFAFVEFFTYLAERA